MNLKLVILFLSAILALGLAEETAETAAPAATNAPNDASVDKTTKAESEAEATATPAGNSNDESTNKESPSEGTTVAGSDEKTTAATDNSKDGSTEQEGNTTQKDTPSGDTTVAGTDDKTTAATDHPNDGSTEQQEGTTNQKDTPSEDTTSTTTQSSSSEPITTTSSTTSTTEGCTSTPTDTTTSTSTTTTTTKGPASFADNVNTSTQNLLGINCMVNAVNNIDDSTSYFKYDIEECDSKSRKYVASLLSTLGRLENDISKVQRVNDNVCKNSNYNPNSDASEIPTPKCAKNMQTSTNKLNTRVIEVQNKVNKLLQNTSNNCANIALFRYRFTLNNFNKQIENCAKLAEKEASESF